MVFGYIIDQRWERKLMVKQFFRTGDKSWKSLFFLGKTMVFNDCRFYSAPKFWVFCSEKSSKKWWYMNNSIFSNKTRKNIIGGPILSPKMLQNERRKSWKSLKCIEISKFSVEEGLTKATEEGNGALGDHFGCSKAHESHWGDRRDSDFRGPGLPNSIL